MCIQEAPYNAWRAPPEGVPKPPAPKPPAPAQPSPKLGSVRFRV